jgi:hypothetical protein
MVFVVAVTVALTLLAQGTSTDGSEVRRYQLQQISEFGPQATPSTVILDTKTGQLWRLVTEKCPDNAAREGWERMPALGKDEYPRMTFSCAPPPR